MFIIDTEEKNNNKKMKNTWANKNIFIKGYIYLSNVFQPGLLFTNLALKKLGSIFGHPYWFNGTKIRLGTTLVKSVAFIRDLSKRSELRKLNWLIFYICLDVLIFEGVIIFDMMETN